MGCNDCRSFDLLTITFYLSQVGYKVQNNIKIFQKLLGEADKTRSSQSQVKNRSEAKTKVHVTQLSLFQRGNEAETKLEMAEVCLYLSDV